MKITIPLKRNRLMSCCDYYTERECLALCIPEVRQLWDIPKGTKEIDVVISSKPMPNSYKVKCDMLTSGASIYYSGKWNRYGLYYHAQRILRETMLQAHTEVLYVKIRC
jgi:hypothetical protein